MSSASAVSPATAARCPFTGRLAAVATMGESLSREDTEADLPVPIPGPHPWDIVGNVRDLSAIALRGIEEATLLYGRKYGPICRFANGVSAWTFVNDAEIIAHICSSNSKNYSRRFLPDSPFHRLFPTAFPHQAVYEYVTHGKGILGSQGEYNRAHRRMCQPPFMRPNLLDAFSDTIQSQLDKLITMWRHQATTDAGSPLPNVVLDGNLAVQIQRFTLDIIGAVAFSKDFGQLDRIRADPAGSATQADAGADELLGAVNESQQLMANVFITPLPVLQLLRRFGEPGMLRLDAAMKAMERVMMGVIEERREKWRATGDAGDDLLGVLLGATPSASLRPPLPCFLSASPVSPGQAGAAAAGRGAVGGRARRDGRGARDHRHHPQTRCAPVSLLPPLSPQDEQGRPLQDEELWEDVHDVMGAGHETTATTITAALFLISQHPEAKAKVQEELRALNGCMPSFQDVNSGRLVYTQMAVKETLHMYPLTPFFIPSPLSSSFSKPLVLSLNPSSSFLSIPPLSFSPPTLAPSLPSHPQVQEELRGLNGRMPSFQDINSGRLAYTQMAVKETLRMYPPIPLFPREVAHTDVLPGGYELPGGDVVFMSTYAMGRNPVYWPEPLSFRPERFTPEAEAVRPRFAWVPFGAGPRMCLGANFAVLAVTQVVATLLQVCVRGGGEEGEGPDTDNVTSSSGVSSSGNHTNMRCSESASAEIPAAIAVGGGPWGAVGDTGGMASGGSAGGRGSSPAVAAGLGGTQAMPPHLDLRGAAIQTFPRDAAGAQTTIVLPNQRSDVLHFALDIGGSLIKLATGGGAFKYADLFKEKLGVATGGGAFKYADLFKEKLGVVLDKEDEMRCLVLGLNFLLRSIQDEAITHLEGEKQFVEMHVQWLRPFHSPSRLPFLVTPACPSPPTQSIRDEAFTHLEGEKQFVEMHSGNIFPYLLVNIGSGVSILKVDGPQQYERVSGTNLGGGTFWGLGSLLTGCKSFDKILELSQEGDNSAVDMLVGDIYGGLNYEKIGLSASTIASSFGRVVGEQKQLSDYRPEDIALSLLRMVSYNIGQIAYLNALRYNLKRIFFGGFFIRGHAYTMDTISFAIKFWLFKCGHAYTMDTISFAIKFWSKGEKQAMFLRHEGSKGEKQAMFLRHEGYLGALGAFLAHEEDAHAEGRGLSLTPGIASLSSLTPSQLVERFPMGAPFSKGEIRGPVIRGLKEKVSWVEKFVQRFPMGAPFSKGEIRGPVIRGMKEVSWVEKFVQVSREWGMGEVLWAGWTGMGQLVMRFPMGAPFSKGEIRGAVIRGLKEKVSWVEKFVQVGGACRAQVGGERGRQAAHYHSAEGLCFARPREQGRELQSDESSVEASQTSFVIDVCVQVGSDITAPTPTGKPPTTTGLGGFARPREQGRELRSDESSVEAQATHYHSAEGLCFARPREQGRELQSDESSVEASQTSFVIDVCVQVGSDITAPTPTGKPPTTTGLGGFARPREQGRELRSDESALSVGVLHLVPSLEVFPLLADPVRYCGLACCGLASGSCWVGDRAGRELRSDESALSVGVLHLVPSLEVSHCSQTLSTMSPTQWTSQTRMRGSEWRMGGNEGGSEWRMGGNEGGSEWRMGGNEGGSEWRMGGNEGGSEWDTAEKEGGEERE
ncbi:unnamed protein product [Closterium sp. NIES-64]|nr:unnamed protein product [Closterium sp. NIES-64]